MAEESDEFIIRSLTYEFLLKTDPNSAHYFQRRFKAKLLPKGSPSVEDVVSHYQKTCQKKVYKMWSSDSSSTDFDSDSSDDYALKTVPLRAYRTPVISSSSDEGDNATQSIVKKSNSTPLTTVQSVIAKKATPSTAVENIPPEMLDESSFLRFLLRMAHLDGDFFALSLVCEYLYKIDASLGLTFQMKTHAILLPKGSPSIMDVVSQYQKNFPEQIAAKVVSQYRAESCDESSDAVKCNKPVPKAIEAQSSSCATTEVEKSDEFLIKCLTYDFLRKVDATLARSYKIKYNARSLPKGSPSIEDVVSYYQKTSQKKLCLKMDTKKMSSSSDSSSSSFDSIFAPSHFDSDLPDDDDVSDVVPIFSSSYSSSEDSDEIWTKTNNKVWEKASNEIWAKANEQLLAKTSDEILAKAILRKSDDPRAKATLRKYNNPRSKVQPVTAKKSMLSVAASKETSGRKQSSPSTAVIAKVVNQPPKKACPKKKKFYPLC